MRVVQVSLIRDAVKEMFIEMNYSLGPDVAEAIRIAAHEEKNVLGKDILGILLENLKVAVDDHIPICQDTGMAVVFLEVGQEVAFTGGSLEEAVQQGIREAYCEGFLRKSVVEDPLLRANTNDNTPGIVYYKIVDGDRVGIRAAAKGFGSENMSRIKMLNPSDGEVGVMDFVVETVRNAGSNPCPPIVVGVGIGGTMEKAALLAKEALLRPLGSESSKKHILAMEKELLKRINALGIGPQGFGGNSTAFGVNIEVFPTHIAGLPVAVNINCHVSRHLDQII